MSPIWFGRPTLLEHTLEVIAPLCTDADNALRIEPLHSIYVRTLLPSLQAALERGVRQATAFLRSARTIIVEPANIARYDPHGYAFINVNTPDDLALARRILDEEGKR